MTDLTPAAEPAETTAAATERRPVHWYDLAIAAAFGLLFAYLVWTAIGNAVNFPQLYDVIGQSAAVPWWLLIISIAVPIVCYVVAFIVSMRRSPAITALVFVMALGAAAALGYTAIGIGVYIFQGLPIIR